MIEILAPKGFTYRDKKTKQIVGKTLYFCDWVDYYKFELVKLFHVKQFNDFLL